MASSGTDVAEGAGSHPRTLPPRSHRRAGNAPLGPWRRGLREAGLGLITLGVIVLLFVGYQLIGTNFAEAGSQSQLAKEFQQALAHNETAPAPAAAAPATPSAPGKPVAGAIDHLVIPKIGVNKYVVEGVNESDLQEGPGHYPQTVMPGELGNAAIAGHRTTFGAPFFRLNELAIGDPIEITNTKDQHFTYLVSRFEVVNPTDVAVLDNTPHNAQLTLTTCNPRFEATTRLVLVATLTGTKPLPAPPRSALLASPAALNLGTGNPSAWWEVALFGALVAAGWAVVRIVINRTRRWPRVAAYVVGIAVCLVPLWFLFQSVGRLLPQNI